MGQNVDIEFSSVQRFYGCRRVTYYAKNRGVNRVFYNVLQPAVCRC